MIRLISFLVFLNYIVNVAGSKCERLKTSLTYKQEKAPRDLSGVLPVVVERVNRVLDGVVDVEVEWDGGDLQGRVGEHGIQCKVTRLASAVKDDVGLDGGEGSNTITDDYGREVVVQCFVIPFTILDTNECDLPVGHPMRHQCHDPSICINTIGSYECLCPLLTQTSDMIIPATAGAAADETFWGKVASKERTAWEVSFNTTSQTSCPSSASTHNCCSFYGHKTEGSACRSAFRCPVDPCKGNNNCDSRARCQRKASPMEKTLNYVCQCPHGLMGNGFACRAGIDAKPQPKVKFDGVTPTEETIRNNYYCSCTKPVVDACAGFPPCEGKHEVCTVTAGNTPTCACKPGFVFVDEYGCVDEEPPVLRLRNDPKGDFTTRLRQGDVYQEYAVDIIDDNAEEYMRSLKITYSQPLPPGCLTKIGEFHVNYTVAMPWASPPYVRVTRRVIIEDIDECTLDVTKYETACPVLVPKCDFDSGAACVNTKGSYTCRCPRFTVGDGFKSISAENDRPEGYKGGSGCRDTSRPVISLTGPNPKILKASKCGGLTGVMGKKPLQNDVVGGSELLGEQRKTYEDDLKELIQFTSGAELCATHRRPNPKPDDCVRATDHTFRGDVDLTSRVVVGEPVQKSKLQWKVPYNVMDDAGNEATTVWRDVVIEEVDLYDLEHKIRMEVAKERDDEVNRLRKQLDEERKKKMEQTEISGSTTTTTVGRRNNRRPTTTTTCPSCPECVCPTSDSKIFDEAKCKEYCKRNMPKQKDTCSAVGDRGDSPGLFITCMYWVEEFIPQPIVDTIFLCVLVVAGLFLLRAIVTFIFNSRRVGYVDYEIEGQAAMQTYNRSPAAAATNSFGGTAPGSMGQHQQQQPTPGSVNGLFSPQQDGRSGMASPFLSPPPGSATRSHQGTPAGSVPGRSDHYDDSIYNTSSIITPSGAGEQQQNTPYNLRRRY